MTGRQVEFHPSRTVFLQMFLRQSVDLIAILIRNETEGKLCHGLASDHCFGPLSLVTAPKAVDLRRRSCPNAFERRKTLFAKQFRHTSLFFDFFISVQRNL